MASEPLPTDVPPWPAEDFERLGRCPLCGSPEQTVLYDGVRDGVFGAPGLWALQRCGSCAAAYLDPRPTEASIGRAYAVYYTHVETADADRPRGGLYWRMRYAAERLRRGWLNARLGHRWPDAHPLGALVHAFTPRQTATFAQEVRHLPVAAPGARLLDVGCGDGAFLPTAKALGYAAVGLEPDPSAVARGRGLGHDIRHGALTLENLQTQDLAPASFDHVTLFHVLEHFHDPLAALANLFALLKPGGRLWIAQPNLAAQGLAEFGADWRGLEAPRHMVLTTPARLVELLTAQGFFAVEVRKPAREASFYFRQSLAMRHGERPYDSANPHWSKAWRAKAAQADARAFARPAVAESMAATAIRP